MRRSIDDYPFEPADLPEGADDAQQLSWAVAISDDYDDAEPRVVLTVEEVGSPGEGLVAHLHPGHGPAAAAGAARRPARDRRGPGRLTRRLTARRRIDCRKRVCGV